MVNRFPCTDEQQPPIIAHKVYQMAMVGYTASEIAKALRNTFNLLMRYPPVGEYVQPLPIYRDPPKPPLKVKNPSQTGMSGDQAKAILNHGPMFGNIPPVEENPTFNEVLIKKRRYYGHTEAAIEFAVEEYLREVLGIQNIDISSRTPLGDKPVGTLLVPREIPNPIDELRKYRRKSVGTEHNCITFDLLGYCKECNKHILKP